MGCDPRVSSLKALIICFNPRTHMGCDRMLLKQVPLYQKFQSTHPHGVRLNKLKIVNTLSKFQSTHPHGVRLQTQSEQKCYLVSIHAPTWGATEQSCTEYICRKFQSTHPHGVRRARLLEEEVRKRFQSTHPHGVRPRISQETWLTDTFQSTHPHGVRLNDFCLFRTRDISFNPRTHMGCDVRSRRAANTRVLFQSTHPHGVRRKLLSDIELFGGFNPRTHMGCDFPPSYVHRANRCFNPRTHMGCDVSYHFTDLTSVVSIHAPTWGATHLFYNV